MPNCGITPDFSVYSAPKRPAADSQSVPGYHSRPDMATITADGRRNMLAVLRFSEKTTTATAARTGRLWPQVRPAAGPQPRAFRSWGVVIPGCVGFAQLPFFADQLVHLFPVSHGKRVMHCTGDLADPFKVVEDFLVAVDVGFKYFPIV